jgi:C-terminal processing protease CtpA/Prc
MWSQKSRYSLATILIFVLAIGTQQLAAAGRPWIGVYMQDVTSDLADAFGLSVKSGVVVNDVSHGSPADKAGLKPKDVILTWNGQKVDNSQALTELVSNSKTGDNVKLTVNRLGKEVDFALQVGERKESEYTTQGNWSPDQGLKGFTERFGGKKVGIGVSMQALSGKLGDYFGVTDGNGALITEVYKDTPAEKAGLQTGDVIVNVDDQKVEGPSDVSSAIGDKKKGDKVDLVVVRDKSEKKISLDVDEIESLGSVDDMQQLMPYFHSGMGNAPMQMYRFDGNYGDMQQKLEDLETKLQDMQKKLDQLESKMK